MSVEELTCRHLLLLEMPDRVFAVGSLLLGLQAPEIRYIHVFISSFDNSFSA